MAQKPEAWRDIARRMYDYHKSMDWKHDEDTFLSVVGYTEFNTQRMPPGMFGKVIRAWKRGYISSNTGPIVPVLNFLRDHCPTGKIRLGYIGRTKMEVYFPMRMEKINVVDICSELNTLYGLETKSNDRPFNALHRDNPDEFSIYARLYTSRRGTPTRAPDAKFVRTKKLIDKYLQSKEALSHRQPMIEWLTTKPIIRVPFSSHLPSGEFRK